MVKQLDEKPGGLPDHVGWRLWQANRRWQQAFVGAMQAAGHGWFSETRASLMGHLPRGGIRQSMLVDATGSSKQAVQQVLDGLEADGIVERVADRLDRRGKFIRYTPKGLAALRDGDSIKLEIEHAWRDALGAERFDALSEALRLVESTQQASEAARVQAARPETTA